MILLEQHQCRPIDLLLPKLICIHATSGKSPNEIIHILNLQQTQHSLQLPISTTLQQNKPKTNGHVQLTTSKSIPGLPFPGRPGIPVIFLSRIPENGSAAFPAKKGTV